MSEYYMGVTSLRDRGMKGIDKNPYTHLCSGNNCCDEKYPVFLFTLINISYQKYA